MSHKKGDMKGGKSRRRSSVVRRSFALPEQVLEEAATLAPPDLRANWNRLVRTALEEFIVQRKRERFLGSMIEMSRDPQARAVNREMFRGRFGAEEDAPSS